MDKVRYGIIGAGNQGGFLAGLLSRGEIGDAVLSAVCDVRPERTAALMKKLGRDVAVFSDYRDMLDSGRIDAAVVATPHYSHPEMVVESLKRGIHALCEKPAGVYAKAVREMNEAAAGSKALFGMMFNQRTNCLYRKMRELAASGAIGRLQRVTWIITDWYRSQFYYDSGAWRATWAGEGGGVLINQCPHQLDLLQWVVGEMPAEIRSFCEYGKWHDVEVEDEVTAYLKYASGATGVFVTTTGETPGTNRFEISGTGGKLVCENNKLTYAKNEADSAVFSATTRDPFGRPAFGVTEVETDGQNPQHAGILRNFAAAALGREPLFVDGKEGIRGVEIMNAIELSTWLNDKVTVPVDEKLYLDELNKRRAVSRHKSGSGTVADTAGTFGA